MGSTFTKHSKSFVVDSLGKSLSIPLYLQFVPGYVSEVVTSQSSMRYNTQDSINSIIAMPHIADDTLDRRALLKEKNRYWPLLRGIVDVPAKGDPVLLCTIGGKNFYLGPLNYGNSPNWNIDILKNPEPAFDDDLENETNIDSTLNKSKNFDTVGINRIQKEFNERLDNPDGDTTDRVFGETHGDLILEGRHGNSLRIGSRHINPYIFISNGRTDLNFVEDISDGTLISITKKGSLNQHFGERDKVIKKEERDDSIGELVPEETKKIPGFLLASDSFVLEKDEAEQSHMRLMSDLISFVNNDEDPQSLIYEYNKDQTLLTSDRIIINSKGKSTTIVDANDNTIPVPSDLFLSSYNDIHMGAGRHLTVSTNEDLIIESQNIYFGKRAKQEHDNKTSEEKDDNIPEPEEMVLGRQLKTILSDLVKCLSEAHFLSPAGNPLPLIDNMQIPLTKDNPAIGKDGRKGLDGIQKSLSKILSFYHYIESNTPGPKAKLPEEKKKEETT